MQADRELFWAPVPGFRGRFLERPVAINSLGVRGPEPAREADRIRVLSFGDSITFGYGVADDETYPAAMGRALEARGVEVVNAGVTGYTSHQVLGLVRRLAPRLPPRLVTICIGWNDGNRRAVDDREWARRLSRASPLGGALERVALFRAMTNLYVRSVVTADKRSGATTQRVPLAHYRENLWRRRLPITWSATRRPRAGPASARPSSTRGRWAGCCDAGGRIPAGGAARGLPLHPLPPARP